MRQLKIAIDHDGVVADLHTEWINRYNRRFDDKKTIEDVVEWDMEKFLTKAPSGYVRNMLNEPGIFYASSDIVGAVGALIDFSKIHDIYILTSASQQTAFFEKKLWYKERVDPWAGYPVSERMIAVSSAEIKKEVLDGFDVFIDDYHMNFNGVNENVVRILMDAPYNRTAVANQLIDVRAKSWNDIREIVHGHSLRNQIQTCSEEKILLK